MDLFLKSVYNTVLGGDGIPSFLSLQILSPIFHRYLHLLFLIIVVPSFSLSLTIPFYSAKSHLNLIAWLFVFLARRKINLIFFCRYRCIVCRLLLSSLSLSSLSLLLLSSSMLLSSFVVLMQTVRSSNQQQQKSYTKATKKASHNTWFL